MTESTEPRTLWFRRYCCGAQVAATPFILAMGAAVTALLLRAQKKHMQLLLDQRDDVLTFRPDGMLVVERPSGETLTFPVASEQPVPLERGFRRYTNGTETYVTCLAVLEPVAQSKAIDEVAHDGR